MDHGGWRRWCGTTSQTFVSRFYQSSRLREVFCSLSGCHKLHLRVYGRQKIKIADAPESLYHVPNLISIYTIECCSCFPEAPSRINRSGVWERARAVAYFPCGGYCFGFRYTLKMWNKKFAHYTILLLLLRIRRLAQFDVEQAAITFALFMYKIFSCKRVLVSVLCLRKVKDQAIFLLPFFIWTFWFPLVEVSSNDLLVPRATLTKKLEFKFWWL